MSTRTRSPRRQPAGRSKPTPYAARSKAPELFIVDGTNVCFWWGHAYKDPATGKDMISIRPLLVLLAEIREHGDDFFCIFDVSTSKHMYNHGKGDHARLIDELVRRYGRWFYRVTGSTSADSAILHHADKFNRRIISNDIYRDYVSVFPWLSVEHTPRLIQGNFTRAGLMTVDKLPYGFMEVSREVKTGVLLRRLVSTLEHGFDWRAPREPIRPQAPTPPVAPQPAAKPQNAASAPAAKAERTKTVNPRATDAKKKPASSKAAKARRLATKPKAKTTTRKASPAKKKTEARRTPIRKTVARRRSPPRKKGFFERLFG